MDLVKWRKLHKWNDRIETQNRNLIQHNAHIVEKTWCISFKQTNLTTKMLELEQKLHISLFLL